VIFFSPSPLAARSAAIASTAASYARPSYWPEFTQCPRVLSSYHGCHASVENVSPSIAITCGIGSPYFFANAKSRSSCAGTPITAPSP
jgi:hypothetical protein